MFRPQKLGYRISKRIQSEQNCREDTIALQKPVVLLRGLGRSSAFWLGFERALNRHADLILVDLLGTGSSPSRWGRYRVGDHAQDVIHTLEEDSLFPCHLGAISFGGMVALKILALLSQASRGRDPQESRKVCSSAVLAASARCTGEKRIDPLAAAALLSTLPQSPPRNERFAHHLVSPAFLKRNPELPQIWNEIYEREGFSRGATIGQLVGAALFHGKNTLESIVQPVLFAASTDDGLVHWRNSVRLAERVRNGSLYIYSGLGHDFPTEIPQELSLRLATFFQKND